MSVALERVDGGVAILRIDRPDVRNALDRATIEALLVALDELAGDPAVHVLVLSTTSTDALCAGADVAEPLTREGGIARMEAFARLYAAFEAFPAPVAAVCVGNVVGAGAELAASADLRIAGDNLKLAWAGARLGVPVGPARLAPLVGVAVAKELVFTGRVVGAEEAVALRLATRAAPAADAEAVAVELARAIAAHPPDGTRRLKAMFRELEHSAERVAYENALLVAFQREGEGLPQGRSRP